MSAQIIPLSQDNEKWHRVRQQFLTATIANALKNEANWPKILSDKLERKANKFKTKAMIKGTRLEPVARNVYNTTSQSNFEPMCVVDKSLGAMCSLDGGTNELVVLLEIKCPEKDTESALYQDALEGKISAAYMDQMQFQLMVTNAQYVIFMVYAGDDKYETILVKRDEDKINLLKDLCLRFWTYAGETFKKAA